MDVTSGIRRSRIVPKKGPGAIGIVSKPTDNRIYVDKGNTYTDYLQTDGMKIVTAALTLTSKDDGLTMFLNTAGGFTITLPTPALGLKFRFIVKTAPTTAYIIAGAAADLIIGSAHSSTGGNADSETTAGATEVTFVASTALAGDWIEMISDGTYWYAQGFSDADGGITFTN